MNLLLYILTALVLLGLIFGKGFRLFIVSIIAALLLFPIGFAWGFVKCFWKRQFKQGLKNLDSKFMILAKSNDKYGAVICAEWFNDVLITKESTHKFGNIEETASMVLGYNQQEKTLSDTGEDLVKALDKIEKDHCLNAIKNDK